MKQSLGVLSKGAAASAADGGPIHYLWLLVTKCLAEAMDREGRLALPPGFRGFSP